MAIDLKKDGDKTIITIDNGHTIALRKIVEDYKLKGEEEALSFMLSIISEADGTPIKTGKGSFLPAEHLKNSEHAS